MKNALDGKQIQTVCFLHFPLLRITDKAESTLSFVLPPLDEHIRGRGCLRLYEFLNSAIDGRGMVTFGSGRLYLHRIEG
jgi:hypothetical protein